MHLGVNLGSFQSPNVTRIQMGVPSLRKRCPLEQKKNSGLLMEAGVNIV